MMKEQELNSARKSYNEPMHTCEHILNQTMIRMFECGRSVNAHIERRKSKCDYQLEQEPTPAQVAIITSDVNAIILKGLAVSEMLMTRHEAGKIVDLSKLPEDASDTLRIIKVGDYDACACIGQHVDNTSKLGRFVIISHNFENGYWRVRFKLVYE